MKTIRREMIQMLGVAAGTAVVSPLIPHGASAGKGLIRKKSIQRTFGNFRRVLVSRLDGMVDMVFRKMLSSPCIFLPSLEERS